GAHARLARPQLRPLPADLCARHPRRPRQIAGRSELPASRWSARTIDRNRGFSRTPACLSAGCCPCGPRGLIMSCCRAAATAPMVPLLTLLWLPALQSPWAQPAAAPAPPSAVAQCDRSRFHALLDVGHTAEAPGARSARGAREFEFNLRLAKEIDERLIEAGFEKTELL